MEESSTSENILKNITRVSSSNNGEDEEKEESMKFDYTTVLNRRESFFADLKTSEEYKLTMDSMVRPATNWDGMPTPGVNLRDLRTVDDIEISPNVGPIHLAEQIVTSTRKGYRQRKVSPTVPPPLNLKDDITGIRHRGSTIIPPFSPIQLTDNGNGTRSRKTSRNSTISTPPFSPIYPIDNHVGGRKISNSSIPPMSPQTENSTAGRKISTNSTGTPSIKIHDNQNTGQTRKHTNINNSFIEILIGDEANSLVEGDRPIVGSLDDSSLFDDTNTLLNLSVTPNNACVDHTWEKDEDLENLKESEPSEETKTLIARRMVLENMINYKKPVPVDGSSHTDMRLRDKRRGYTQNSEYFSRIFLEDVT